MRDPEAGDPGVQTYAAPDLDTADFTATATHAAEACAGLASREQAARLAEDGLLGILASDSVDGLGLPLGYALPVVEAAAAAQLGFPLAETMLVARALEASNPDLASALCEGRRLATVAWRADAAFGTGGSALSGHARAPGATEADLVLVPTADGRAALIETGAAGVSLGAPDDLEPSRPQVPLALEAVPVGQDRIVGDAALRRLRSDALLLRAAAILGASSRCLDLSVEYATTRQQFGKALSANQAMRHLLGRQKLTLEGLRAALDRAAVLDHGRAAEIARLAAFTYAAQGGTSVAEAAIHVHGGMGFTWEVPLHLHLRRIRALAVEADAPAVADDLAATFMAGVEVA